MKFELKNAKKIDRKELKGWVYSTKEDFKNASAIYFEIDGTHGKVKSTLNDRVYFIIEGEGEFIINDEVIPVKKFDVIIVPKNTPYNYRGKMKMFLVHTPAFDPEFDIKLK
jgi:mannose-6-phosphate isomerase-like protein (cupin superfamily)